MRLSKKRQKAILLRVRELVARPYGWTKGDWKRRQSKADGGYAYCLLGACQQAYTDVTGLTDKSDGNKIADAISLATAVKVETGKSIISFNDSKSTKKRDVLAVLDRKIEEVS